MSCACTGSKLLPLGIDVADSGGGACDICSGTVGSCTVGLVLGVGICVVPVAIFVVDPGCDVTGNAGACTVTVLCSLCSSAFGHILSGWYGTWSLCCVVSSLTGASGTP